MSVQGPSFSTPSSSTPSPATRFGTQKPKLAASTTPKFGCGTGIVEAGCACCALPVVVVIGLLARKGIGRLIKAPFRAIQKLFEQAKTLPSKLKRTKPTEGAEPTKEG